MKPREIKQSLEKIRTETSENKRLLEGHIDAHDKAVREIIKKNSDLEITVGRQFLLIESYELAFKMLIVQSNNLIENLDHEDFEGMKKFIVIQKCMNEYVVESYKKHFLKIEEEEE